MKPSTTLSVHIVASTDKLRQTIDGTLVEEGKDAGNVQVALEGANNYKPTFQFALEDWEGQYLTMPATEEETHSESPNSSEHTRKAGSRNPEKGARSPQWTNHTLKAEVSGIEEKIPIRDQLPVCDVAKYDEIIAAKDSESEAEASALLSVRSAPSHAMYSRDKCGRGYPYQGGTLTTT